MNISQHIKKGPGYWLCKHREFIIGFENWAAFWSAHFSAPVFKNLLMWSFENLMSWWILLKNFTWKGKNSWGWYFWLLRFTSLEEWLFGFVEIGLIEPINRFGQYLKEKYSKENTFSLDLGFFLYYIIFHDFSYCFFL